MDENNSVSHTATSRFLSIIVMGELVNKLGGNDLILVTAAGIISGQLIEEFPECGVGNENDKDAAVTNEHIWSLYSDALADTVDAMSEKGKLRTHGAGAFFVKNATILAHGATAKFHTEYLLVYADQIIAATFGKASQTN